MSVRVDYYFGQSQGSITNLTDKCKCVLFQLMGVMVPGLPLALAANTVEVERKQEQENATDLRHNMVGKIVLAWGLHLKQCLVTQENALQARMVYTTMIRNEKNQYSNREIVETFSPQCCQFHF